MIDIVIALFFFPFFALMTLAGTHFRLNDDPALAIDEAYFLAMVSAGTRYPFWSPGVLGLAEASCREPEITVFTASFPRERFKIITSVSE
jgi:hypothetical protein